MAILAFLALTGRAAAQDGSSSVPRGGSGVVQKPTEEEAPKPVIQDPVLLEFANADYPPEALAAGIQGTVVLKLTIDKEGKVTAAEVLEPAGHGFDEAARVAALKFRYQPATRDGKPFAVKIPYAYKFTITEVAAPEPPPMTTGVLGGELRIAGTDSPLVGAEVVVTLPDGSERRIVTDGEGRWRLDGVAPGRVRLKVAVEGYDPADSQEEVAVGEETLVTLRLTPASDGLEVIVRGERPAREVTRRTVERREIERIPGTGGDALRSIQNLPGVARPPGFSGLLIVRGSAPNDTATFIDTVDVPLIYHFGSFTSVVPTELLEQIDFYPGNFSARYGRVSGGIVDAKLRTPDTRCYTTDGKIDTTRKNCVHGLVQADFIDARALLQGPLPIKGWSFAVAGRRSWLDSWLKPVLEETGAGVTTAPVYYDYQLLTDHTTAKSRLSFRFFGADDRTEILINDPAAQDPAFGGNVRLGTAFYRGQILYETELNSNVSLNTSLAVGKDAANFRIGNFYFLFDSIPILARYELGFKLFKGAKLDVGLDFQMADYEVSVRFPPPPRPGETPGVYAGVPPIETHDEGFGFRPAWYAELELEPAPGLRVVPGVRADYYRDTGHGDIAPRVSARYDIVRSPAPDAPNRRRTTLKGGAGLFYQPPQYDETDPNFGTPDLYSNRAAHYSIGAEQELTQQVDLGVEGFYKDLTSQVSRTPAANAQGYAYNNEGSGYAMGIETMLKYKPDKRFFGWLAYTLSRSVRQDGPGEPDYLFQYDQTHNLTVLGSYRLGRGWEFGARFRLVSGPLTTEVVPPPSLPAIYSFDGSAYAPIQGQPFNRRLPLFHQLDVRIDKRWQLKNARLSAYLDIQNVYNNSAVEDLVYNYDFSQQGYQTGVPIIPSLGLRLEI